MDTEVTAQLPPLKTGFPQSRYLPIEYLREPEVVRSLVTNEAKLFRSSGTTARHRAQSPFSHFGIQSYRKAALKHFRRVLSQAGASGHCGISLIPPVTEWPDSSLAQMLEWIGEQWPLEYQTVGGLQSFDIGEPCFLFGTGFHFVSLWDQGVQKALPPGSLVIETGGTKGRTRSVSRSELHGMIMKMFGVSRQQIISEYGMCELAAQAYEWETGGERFFRFADDVKVAVTTGDGTFHPKGTGALTVFDPNRKDLPYPIRTEDVVTLEADGRFQLHGRIKAAPLKGCSLAVEEIVQSSSPEPPVFHQLSPAVIQPWGQNAFVDWLKSDKLRQLLANDLGSKTAVMALDGIMADLPKDNRGLLQQLQRNLAFSHSLPRQGRWLVILPDNHPLAGIYPLVAAAMLGQPLLVRLPKHYGQRDFLAEALEFLSQYSAIATVSAKWRIYQKADLPEDVSGVMAFGSDQTITRLQTALTDTPVAAFGHRTTVSVLSQQDFATNFSALLKDAFSLRQRGCLSSRLAFVVEPEPGSVAQFLRSLQARTQLQQFCDPLSAEEQLHLELEFCRQHHQSEVIRPLAQGPCFFLSRRSSVAAEELLSPAAFALPICLMSSLEEVKSALKSSASVTLAGVSRSLLKEIKSSPTSNKNPVTIPFVKLGDCQKAPWDGTATGQRLFVCGQKN